MYMRVYVCLSVCPSARMCVYDCVWLCVWVVELEKFRATTVNEVPPPHTHTLTAPRRCLLAEYEHTHKHTTHTHTRIHTRAQEGTEVLVDDLRLVKVKAIPGEPMERQCCFEIVTLNRYATGSDASLSRALSLCFSLSVSPSVCLPLVGRPSSDLSTSMSAFSFLRSCTLPLSSVRFSWNISHIHCFS